MLATQPEFNTDSWPVLTTYDQDHLLRIALPLGGIGTGTVSLGGRGNLRDWELANRPAKGFIPTASGVAPCFVLAAQAEGAPPVTRLLEGPLDASEYEGASGSPVPNHGLPRFRQCSFAAAYPFGQVRLADPDVPLIVRLEAYNPSSRVMLSTAACRSCSCATCCITRRVSRSAQPLPRCCPTSSARTAPQR